MSAELRLHQFLPASRANGPGRRAVLWFQGCSLNCPGCFNPQTHAFSGGEGVTVEEMVARLVGLGDSIEGVTLSGGEPFQHRLAVLSLLSQLRAETKLGVLV